MPKPIFPFAFASRESPTRWAVTAVSCISLLTARPAPTTCCAPSTLSRKPAPKPAQKPAQQRMGRPSRPVAIRPSPEAPPLSGHFCSPPPSRSAAADSSAEAGTWTRSGAALRDTG